MQICVENIEYIYVMPGVLKFDGDCLIVLRESLLAVAPQEGCALLVGDHEKSDISGSKKIWNVRLIWPCCNIWGDNSFALIERLNPQRFNRDDHFSKANHFLIDPREQLHAQRWARKHNWEVLGSAHSHPLGEAIPSRTDRFWASSPRLMVILSKTGLIQSWWLPGGQSSAPKRVAHFEN